MKNILQLTNKIGKNKISRYFIILLLTLVSANLNATPLKLDQIIKEKKVTIDVTNKTLDEIMLIITQQTTIGYGYSSTDINKNEKFNLNVSNESVENTLNKLFHESKYSYQLTNNKILIIKRQTKKVEQIAVGGKVVDENNKPIIGATVLITGTPTGAITNNQGEFKLKMNSGEKIEISFVGYVSQEKVVNSSTSNLVIKLDLDIMAVDDVIINTGYTSVNRRNMVGSFTTIKADDIKVAGAGNIAEMLQGQVAGMIVTNTSSRAGATPQIQIRGKSTVLGNSDPIWVVDGIIQDDPISLNNKSGMIDDLKNIIGNQVSWLNPNDIETITVLKDASATAIYGSRASNGVIVITTKKAKSDKINISYNGSLSIKPRPHYGMFNYMNSKERVAFSQEAMKAGMIVNSDVYAKQEYTIEGLEAMYIDDMITRDEYTTKRAYLETVNTDWFDILTRTSFSQSHNVSINGRSEKVNYNVSVGYDRNNGQEIKNSSERLTARTGIGMQLHKKFRVDFSINGSVNKNIGMASGREGISTPMSYATNTSRALPASNADGSKAFYFLQNRYQLSDPNVDKLSFNYLNELEHSSGTVKNGALRMSLNTNWDITKWLKYQFVGGYSYADSRSQTYRGERTWAVANYYRGYDYGSELPSSVAYKAAVLPHGGILDQNFVNTQSYNIQNKLIFDYNLKDAHTFNAMLAHEIRSNINSGHNNTLWGYIPERGNQLASPTPPDQIIPGHDSNSWLTGFGLLDDIYNGFYNVTNRTDNFMSIFATFAYSYKSRYVLNANIRNDFSNRFGQDTNNRFDPTYSLGLMWRISEEEFMRGNMKWLSNLQFSATYGIQGNALLTQSPELILYLGKLNSTFNEFSSKISNIPNKNLSWERTTNWNFSVNGRLFNALNVVADYYTRKSNAIIAQVIPAENGVNTMQINGGMVYNSGIEFSVSFSPVTTKNFGLNISVNSSKNWNSSGKPTEEIKINDFLSGANNKLLKEGYPLGSKWAFDFAGLDPATGRPLFNRLDVDPALASVDPSLALKYIGSSTPDFTGGINLSVRYKKLTVSSTFSLLLGGNVSLPDPYNILGVGASSAPDPLKNASKLLNNRWKKPGDEKSTIYPALSSTITTLEVPGSSTRYYEMEMWRRSDAMMIKSSFLRCGNLSFAYSFGDKMVQSLKLSNVRVTGSVSNLFVIANKRFNGFDPELNESVMPRTFSLGLSLGF